MRSKRASWNRDRLHTAAKYYSVSLHCTVNSIYKHIVYSNNNYTRLRKRVQIHWQEMSKSHIRKQRGNSHIFMERKLFLISQHFNKFRSKTLLMIAKKIHFPFFFAKIYQCFLSNVIK